MKKLLVVSLPFATGLDDWLKGQKPTGTASIFYLVDKCAQKGVHIHWLMLDWTDALPEGKALHKKGVVTVECVMKPSQTFARHLDSSERGILHRFLKLFDIFPLYKRITTVAKEFEPDVIYSVGIYGVLGTLIAKRLGIPSVTRMLGVFLTPYLDCWWRPIKTWNEILTLIFKPDLLIITNDGTGGDNVAKHFKISKENFWFPINGVSKNQPKDVIETTEIRKMYEIPPKVPLVISIGRLVAWKRMDRLIQGFSIAVKELTPKPHLVILGDGPDRRKLEEQVKANRLSRHVKLLGNVAKKEVYALLSVANFAVFIYEYSNVGSALLETLQAGKPVITLANGDTDKFVIHDETGILLDANPTPQELAKAIKKILKNKELELRLGNRAAKWADEHIKTWDERMDDEYNHLERLVPNTSDYASRLA